MMLPFRFYNLFEVRNGAGLVSRDSEGFSVFSVVTNLPGQQEVHETLSESI